MKRFHRGLAVCLAVFYAGVSWGQSPHAHNPRVAGQKAPERPMSSAALPVRPAAAVPGEFDSVFSDYRRFNADEPLIDWRAANDEVRNAGGHVGLMRATQGARGDRPHADHKAGTQKEPQK